MPKGKARKYLQCIDIRVIFMECALISASLIRAKCQNTQVSQVSGVVSSMFSNSSILNEGIKHVKMCV